jgi:SCY1-like protein 1
LLQENADHYSELATVAESDDFPEEFFKVKVLPELLKSVEFGGGGPKSLALVMRIAAKLTDEEYDTRITPVIVRLFTIPDRAMRVCLLDNLPHMIDHLSQKLVTDKIFPQMVTGFGDLAPIVREQTVKAVLVVVSKLSDRVINGELLRHLAKTANDDQPGIRTNTTICLGKIARNLGPGTRTKVLTAAFCRSLRDPFVHARNAALMALAATVDVFGDDDCATKLLPSMCPLLVDKERIIRDQANKTLNVYLERVRKYSLTLPDTILPPPDSASAGGTRVNSPQPNAAAGGVQAGSQWMGWAISSFTNKLGTATGEMQSEGTANTATRPDLNRSSSTPSTTAAKPSLPSSVRASHLSHNNSSPALPKVSSSLRNTTTSAATTPAVEDEDFGADAWGDLDDDDANNTTNDDGLGADAWDTPPTSSHASTAATPKANYDDGGEPDFEGWLNAQNNNKSAAGKKPLPKGLAKKVPNNSAGAASTTRTPSSKPIFANAKKAPVVKKEAAAPAPAKEDQNDDWGDAWD